MPPFAVRNHSSAGGPRPSVHAALMMVHAATDDARLRQHVRPSSRSSRAADAGEFPTRAIAARAGERKHPRSRGRFSPLFDAVMSARMCLSFVSTMRAPRTCADLPEFSQSVWANEINAASTLRQR